MLILKKTNPILPRFLLTSFALVWILPGYVDQSSKVGHAATFQLRLNETKTLIFVGFELIELSDEKSRERCWDRYFRHPSLRWPQCSTCWSRDRLIDALSVSDGHRSSASNGSARNRNRTVIGGSSWEISSEIANHYNCENLTDATHFLLQAMHVLTCYCPRGPYYKTSQIPLLQKRNKLKEGWIINKFFCKLRRKC